MTRPFGYLVFASAGLNAHAQRLNPAVMMFIDNTLGAMQFAQAFPQCHVSSRIFKPDEAVMHRTPGATLAYAQARAREVSANIYINVACEPDLSRPDDLQKLADEQMKVAQWAVTAGRHVCLLHLAHYGLDDRHWPVLAPLADYAAQHRDLIVLSCDEYGAGHMFSGVVDPRLSAGSEAGHIQPETWLRSPTDTYYHVGRITGFIRWLRANNKRIPRIWITEHGVDALNDVTTWRNSLIRTPGYSDIRGWRSLQAQWQQWYGARGWSPARAYAKMVMAARREIYKPYWNVQTREGVEAAMIYCYGLAPDPQWHQFDVASAPDFLAELESYPEETVVSNPPVTKVPKPADAGAGEESIVSQNYRLRAAPAGSVITIIPAGNKVTYYPNRTHKPVVDGLTWQYVEFGNVAGFMADEGQFTDPTFWLMNPCAFEHVITSRMDATRMYGKHEGVDFAPTATAPEPHIVRAAHYGIVSKVANNPTGYGLYVRIDHEWNGAKWVTWYGHLSEQKVIEGQHVRAGQAIGIAGNTGNSTAEHVHLTLQRVGRGMDGYVVDDVVDPLPYLSREIPPEPEPEPTTDYFVVMALRVPAAALPAVEAATEAYTLTYQSMPVTAKVPVLPVNSDIG